jgi:putative hemolysin
MNKRVAVIVWIIGALWWPVACAPTGDTPTVATGESADMPNPASVYCEQQGGRVEMRTHADGTYGVCRFADGGECEEWAYYRGECSPGLAPAAPVQISDAAAAREAALDYLRGQNVAVPAGDAIWDEQDLNDEGLLGAGHLRYTAGEWTVEVSFPIVPLEVTLYTITVHQDNNDFAWQGEVNAAGEVNELGD